MTDDDLIGYADIHCRTELALFAIGDVVRLMELSGHELSDELAWRAKHFPNSFLSVGPEEMLPLLAEIRAIRSGR